MTESEKNELVTKGFLEERLLDLEEKLDQKFVTQTMFERAMASIAESFARHDKLFEKIFEVLYEIKADTKEIRKIIHEHDITLSAHDRKIDNLTERVELIEKKA